MVTAPTVETLDGCGYSLQASSQNTWTVLAGDSRDLDGVG